MRCMNWGESHKMNGSIHNHEIRSPKSSSPVHSIKGIRLFTTREILRNHRNAEPKPRPKSIGSIMAGLKFTRRGDAFRGKIPANGQNHCPRMHRPNHEIRSPKSSSPVHLIKGIRLFATGEILRNHRNAEPGSRPKSIGSIMAGLKSTRRGDAFCGKIPANGQIIARECIAPTSKPGKYYVTIVTQNRDHVPNQSVQLWRV